MHDATFGHVGIKIRAREVHAQVEIKHKERQEPAGPGTGAVNRENRRPPSRCRHGRGSCNNATPPLGR